MDIVYFCSPIFGELFNYIGNFGNCRGGLVPEKVETPNPLNLMQLALP